MSSKNTTFNNPLVFKILDTLRNTQPKSHQIELLESLLSKTVISHQLLFNQKLSASETNCLLLTAIGNTIKQTAQLLSVKHSTIVTLRKRIMSKLKCRSMAQAVFIGIQYGYLPAACKNYLLLNEQARCL
jgi:DNA-binding CsgD family transcriptional regulator